MHINLRKNEMRSGYVRLEDAAASTLPRLISKLSQADQARLETFLHFEDKVAFAAGRLLVRKLLSDCYPEPPGGWSIDIERSGKPKLLRTASAPDLRFNITHCSGLVAAVVALGRDVGIDAEFIRSTTDYVEIAQTHLPVVEVNFLAGLQGMSRRDAFFNLWTLREAYLKATGTGLRATFTDVHFSLNPPTVVSISSGVASAEWFLWRDEPTPTHVLAVAARREPSEELFCLREFVDLESLCR